MEKTTLYLGLFFKLHFFNIFLISLLFFGKFRENSGLAMDNDSKKIAEAV